MLTLTETNTATPCSLTDRAPPALRSYFIFPYQIESGLYKTFASGWVLQRFLVNFCITFGYFGYWHCSLYNFNMGARKFNANTWPSSSTMVHNLWYSFLGVAQWTVWEALFLHCYATGKVSGACPCRR
jgi:hypothetical protein